MEVDLDAALSLHEKLMEDPSRLYVQSELEAMLPMGTKGKLMGLVQELINVHMLKLHKGDELFYQPISKSDADRLKGLNNDEIMVYSHIQAAGREGIWTKAIKNKTNLHQHVVMKCLKSLENSRHIKSVKSVKTATRKIYMLYELQPSIEVTGGPWFTDSELDEAFVNLLLSVVWTFIKRKTFPMASQDKQVVQESQVPNYPDYPTLESIHDFVANSGVATVALSIEDISALCDVLVFDDKIERNIDGSYRAIWSSMLEEKGVKQQEFEFSGFLQLPSHLSLDEVEELA